MMQYFSSLKLGNPVKSGVIPKHDQPHTEEG